MTDIYGPYNLNQHYIFLDPSRIEAYSKLQHIYKIYKYISDLQRSREILNEKYSLWSVRFHQIRSLGRFILLALENRWLCCMFQFQCNTFHTSKGINIKTYIYHTHNVPLALSPPPPQPPSQCSVDSIHDYVINYKPVAAENVA